MLVARLMQAETREAMGKTIKEDAALEERLRLAAEQAGLGALIERGGEVGSDPDLEDEERRVDIV